MVWALAAGAVIAAVALALALGAGDGDEGSSAAPAVTSTTIDLGSVTNEELEQVVNEHPEVVPMRLRLIERFIIAQDFESAQLHAEEAVVRSTTVQERSLALTWLGLSTAVLGDPVTGEGLLVQSLALDPTNRESLYNLARVRFEYLDPSDAIGPLDQLLALGDLSDEQRTLFEDMLAQARIAAGLSAATTSTSTSTP